MIYETLRLSNRQCSMLNKISVEYPKLKSLHQGTLKSLVQRGFLSVGPNSVHITTQGLRALKSLFDTNILRKTISDRLFSGFELYAGNYKRRKA